MLDMHGADATGTNTMTYSVSGLPPGLSINSSTGLITGNIDFNATSGGVSVTFTPTVTLNDGNGGIDTRTLEWEVSDALLTANDDSYTLAHDQVLAVPAGQGVLANDQAAVPGNLTASLSSGPSHGTLTFNSNGSFLYTPDAGYVGQDSFTYTVTDSTSNTTTGLVELEITNITPQLEQDHYTLTHDQPLFVEAAMGVLANDFDSDAVDGLTASLSTGPSHGTLTLFADGAFIYIPDAGYTGNDSFTYTASDGADSVAETVYLEVTNDPPVANDDSYGVQANQALTMHPGVLLNDTDSDGDALTASLVSGPSNGSLTFHANGSFTYTPSASYTGPDSFTYLASDGVDSTTATVTLNVHSVNTTPSTNPDSYSVQHDQVLSVASSSGVLANDTDADSDPLAATLASGPSDGAITFWWHGGFVYTPDPGFTGTDSFTYTASDGQGNSSTTTVNLTVTNPNAPVGMSDSYTLTRNNPLVMSAIGGVLANDTDDDADDILTASLSTGPSYGTLSLNPDGSFEYIPDADYTGSDSFTYTVSDGALTSSPVTVNLSVTANAPVANDDVYAVLKNTTLSIPSGGVLFNDYNPDSISLTASLSSGPSYGTVTLNADGSFDYVPDTNYTGSDSFTYTVSDGSLTATATVSITVNDSNTAPTAGDLTFTLAHDSALSTDGSAGVLSEAADSDNDPLLATLVTGPSYGTLWLGLDGAIFYIPNASYVGTDSFTFQVFDGTTSSGTATVSLTITNEAPEAVPDTYSVLPSGMTSVDEGVGVLANDSDPEGDSLTPSLVSGPSSGSLTFNSDGSIDYTPGGGFSGTDSFTYTVSDGVNSSGTATVTLTSGPGGRSDLSVVA